MFESGWSVQWRESEGWSYVVGILADYNPVLMREITEHCTLVEIARAYKTKVSNSAYAMNDPYG